MIDAMKQALEALEDCLEALRRAEAFGEIKVSYEAITALRQAIKESTNSTKPVAEFDSGYGLQEPVAWMYVNEDGECEQIEYGVSTVTAPYITLLYTALPKREIEQAHTDHPARHWDRTCPACVAQCETPDDLLRQSEREGWRYAKECEAEIDRLKEIIYEIDGDDLHKREWVDLTLEETFMLESKYSASFRTDHNDALDLISHVEFLLKERNT